MTVQMDTDSKQGISTRRDKFHQTFNKSLILSQDLVLDIKARLKAIDRNLEIDPMHDTSGFEDYDGKKRRYCDMQVQDRISNMEFWVEGKDFPRLVKHPATGLPINLVERYRSQMQAKPLFLIFRDNDDPKGYIEARLQRAKDEGEETSREIEENLLISAGHAHRNDDGTVTYIPYGVQLAEAERMYRYNSLEGCKNDGTLICPCKFKDEDQAQHFYGTSEMKTLEGLIPDVLAKFRAGKRYLCNKYPWWA